MPQELKPCPYCGNRELGKEAYGAEVWIQCYACEMRGPTMYSQVVDHTEAIEAWNALPRTPDPLTKPNMTTPEDWFAVVEAAAYGDMDEDPEVSSTSMSWDRTPSSCEWWGSDVVSPTQCVQQRQTRNEEMYFRYIRTFRHDVLGKLAVYEDADGESVDTWYFMLKEIVDMLLITDNNVIRTTCRNIIRARSFTPDPEGFPTGHIIGRKDLYRLANVGDGKRSYLMRRWLRFLGLQCRRRSPDKSKRRQQRKTNSPANTTWENVKRRRTHECRSQGF